jgi:hypothetical protein
MMQVFAALMSLIAGILVPVIALYVAGMARDAWLAAGMSAVLLVISAAYLTVARRFRPVPMLAALALCEVLVIVVIGVVAYDGIPRIDAFFLSWFGGLGALIAIAWCGGIVIGRALRLRVDRT